MNKRSKAMKESWAKRRNSPMRVQARKRKVTQRVTLTSELKDIGTMLAQIGMGVNEVRSMVAAPPSGAVAHSVEVSKRVDGIYRSTTEQIVRIHGMIKGHVDAYEKRLAELEFQFPMLLNRVKELEAKLSPKIGTGNKQGVWMDRDYVKSLEAKLASKPKRK